MLVEFFFCLRKYGLKSSISELLDLLAALEHEVISGQVEQFYNIAKLTLVKDESQYDRFDRAFAAYFEGVEAVDLAQKIPSDWLERSIQRQLSDEERAQLQRHGGLKDLLDAFAERLAEQQKRHAGGNKWIGTGGSSAFGAYGYHPEGIRIGQHGSNQRRAVKVWDQREYRDLDSDEVINHRTIQMALRSLRRFARSGAELELDLAETIRATSAKAGWLDLQWQRERHNAIKVLILFDVGGSMDDFIYECQQLFAAARSEFKQLEFFYFHNCLYEQVWKHNSRRFNEKIPLAELINRFGRDYKLIFVGDATMGPYEITHPGGSVEHWNEQPAITTMQRALNHFSKSVWLNPQPFERWHWHPSIGLLQEIMGGRMYPLSIDGLNRAIRSLL
jgi:uncharacterized protein